MSWIVECTEEHIIIIKNKFYASLNFAYFLNVVQSGGGDIIEKLNKEDGSTLNGSK